MHVKRSSMSQRLKENGSFLNLLLKSSKQQKRALLDTVSPEQADFVGELLHNFINYFPIPDKEKKRLSRKKTFAEIANLKRSYKFRKAKIKQCKKDILLLIEQYQKQLSTLLDK